MSRTRINVSAVIDASSQINAAKTYVSSAKSSFTQTKNSIDGKIKNRYNINDRLSTVQRQLSNICSKVGNIHSTVQSGANQYRATDDMVESIRKQMKTNISAKNIVSLTSKWEKYFKTSAEKVENKSSIDKDLWHKLFGKGVSFEEKLLKALAEIGKVQTKKGKTNSNHFNSKTNDFALLSSSLSYLSGLHTFLTTDYTDTSDIVAGGLKFTKSSTSMWNGVYKYLEKDLLKNHSAIQASRFGKKYQTKVGIVSLVGNICGFTGSAVQTVKTFLNKDATISEKIDSVLSSASSGTGIAQSAVNLKYGQKVLSRNVTAKYQWGTSTKNVAKLDKVTAIISVLGVTIDSFKGGNLKYSEVTADGRLDMGDMGEIGVSTAISGLASVIGKATFGVTDALGLSEKASAFSDKIIDITETGGSAFIQNHKFSSAYVRGAQPLVDYSNDESNNIVFRVGAASVAGAGMVCSVTIDAVSDGVCWMGEKISSGWKAIKNIF